MIRLSRAARTATAAIWNARKSQALHGLVSVLAMLATVLSTSGPAHAGMVTAPNAALVNYQSPLTVSWNGIANSNGVVKPVDIDLVVGTNNTLVGIAAFANNVANNGHYALTLAPGACHELPPGYYYQVIVQAGFFQPGADWAVSAPFRFNCPFTGGSGNNTRRIFSTGSLHPYRGHAHFGSATQTSEKSLDALSPQNVGPGSLHIYKSVGYMAGLPVPPNFAMTVNCMPSGPVNQAVSVPSSPGGLTIGGIAANSACTVTETPLAPIAHAPGCGGGIAHWVSQLPQSVTIAANTTTTVTVSNWLQCGLPSGWIAVNKVVVNATGAPVPVNFAMTAHCNESAGPTTVPLSLQANPGYWESFGTDAGSNCTITEATLAPITHVKGCNGGSASWTTSYAPAQSVISVDGTLTHVTVMNTLACDHTATGHLSVFKTVVNATGDPAPPIPSSFSVAVHCTPRGPPNTALMVPANSGVSLAASIPANSNCSVIEPQLASIPNMKACKGRSASWTTSYSPAVTITAGAISTLTVTNTLTCDKAPDTGSLKVLKSVTNATGAPAPIPAAFAMTADCTPSGPSHQSLSVVPGGAGTTITGIAAQSHCTVVETPLASITHVEGCHGGSASWTTLIAPAQPVSIAANTITNVAVRNTLACDKPAGTASLTIFKKVINDSPIPPPDVLFYVDVNCQTNGPNTTVKLGSGNNYHDAVSGIAIGSNCAITEQVPSVPADLARRGCHWVTDYPDDQRVPISSAEGAKLTVVNHWVCKTGSGDGTGTGTNTDGKPYDLSIKKTAPDRNWPSGSAGVFHLVVTNNGAAISPPLTVAVNDNLPAGMTLVAAAGSGWTCGSSAPVMCTYGGAVPAGQSLPPISITAIAGKQGGVENCATVALGGALDSVAANNKDCISVKIGKATLDKDNSITPIGGLLQGGVDIGIANTVTSGTLPAEGTGVFELTVTNFGAPLDKNASIELHDMLPSGLILKSAVPASSAWQCRTSGNNLACRLGGGIQTGMLPKIRVTARAIRIGTFNNCASVNLIGATEQMPANNSSCATLRVGLDTKQTPTMPPSLIVPPPPPKHDEKPDKKPDDHKGAGP